MKRTAFIFLIGVFLPSFALGWLALRSIGEQQIILERRTAELYQSEADQLAAETRETVFQQQAEFSQSVRKFLVGKSLSQAVKTFTAEMNQAVPDAIAFVISPEGKILSPELSSQTSAENSRIRRFLAENRTFLSGEIETEVFQLQKIPQPAPSLSRKQRSKESASSTISKPVKSRDYKQQAIVRNVIPQRSQAAEISSDKEEAAPANLAPQFSDFRSAVSHASDGILARFVNNELQWVFWEKPPATEGYIFGWMLPADAMHKRIQTALDALALSHRELCFAVLDERGQPVFRSPANFHADWKHPFVAAEIGDAMPFWEAVAYLADPHSLNTAADAIHSTLLAIIALSLGAIIVAGYLVVKDTKRQLALAQKKTDFVSNVSHELKTPLTSIRMFSELLEGGGVSDTARRDQYLRIITLESERLTRLINNVLDFARIEKKRKTFSKTSIDFFPVLERVWTSTQLHLKNRGYTCTWTAADGPYPLFADADALSQVLVNLFSNAEKYGGEAKILEMHSWIEGIKLHIAIMDRGSGVPLGEEKKIFEAFYRAHDSLSSGIQGSGLGLTLAARIVQEHRGQIICSARRGGGSCFTVIIPLHNETL